MRGFFPKSQLRGKGELSVDLVPKCGKCKLWEHCHSPKMPVSGKGRRKILILGEAPCREEDNQNRQFVGDSGQKLRYIARRLGVDIQQDCWITNSIICRPENNAKPTDAQINFCRPNLTKTIRELEPDVIIPLGAIAVKSLIGGFWKKDVGGISRWAGWKIPCQKPNVWICPTYHPAYLLRNRKNKAVEMFFTRHLKAAFALTGKPWSEVPDYKKEIEVLLDEDRACRAIKEIYQAEGEIAFDYETRTLKPESHKAAIFCCSICLNGTRTISYPWTPKTKKETLKVLLSEKPKIGANMKFEDRHTRKEFGEEVKNWKWDVVTNAHILDNRKGVTGVKFQSFVLFGLPSYNDHLESYLRSEGGNTPNRIHKIDMDELCLYCGIDSLIEYKIYERQRSQFK